VTALRICPEHTVFTAQRLNTVSWNGQRALKRQSNSNQNCCTQQWSHKVALPQFSETSTVGYSSSVRHTDNYQTVPRVYSQSRKINW